MVELNAIATDSSNIQTGGGIYRAPNISPLRADMGVASDNDDATMSFGDFLDMINPLQHIPVLSSLYRSATGETINPVSRIAGDALYAGPLGIASAGLAALGAIGDEMITANTGQSTAGNVVASLFGSDTPATTHVASANTTPSIPTATPPSGDTLAATEPTTAEDTRSSIKLAALQTPARQTPILQLPENATAQTAEATTAKQPFGGVMDTTTLQNAQQNQALALALVSGAQNMESQHALRNSRFATSTANPATGATKASASLPLPGDTPSLSGASNLSPTNMDSVTGSNPTSAATKASPIPWAQVGGAPPSFLQPNLSQAAIDSLKQIKGLDQYRSTAATSPVMGNMVNTTN